jgi:putative SOS response-associated peptidase YedK
MCGRYELHTPRRKVIKRFLVDEPVFEFAARYNIAPSQEVAAVILDESGARRRLVGLSWGLVPSWSKERNPKVRPINAKAETLQQKPRFKRSLERRRCLIPASGFFEWKKEGRGKTPIYFRRKDEEPFAFAGIWDEWKGSSEPLRSCCIITVPPNALVSPVHDRMPAMLGIDDEAKWLEGDTETALSSLGAYPAGELEAFPVSRRVGTPSDDDPSLIVPEGAA